MFPQKREVIVGGVGKEESLCIVSPGFPPWLGTELRSHLH